MLMQTATATCDATLQRSHIGVGLISPLERLPNVYSDENF